MNQVLQSQQLFVAPFQYSMVAFCDSLVAYIRVLDFAGMIAQWSMEWLPIAGNPDLKINPNGREHAEEFQIPYFNIGPEDIAMLEADCSKQQRYAELVVHT